MLYGCLYALKLLGAFRHLHLILLLIEYAVLLPLLLRYLRNSQRMAQSRWMAPIPEVRVLISCFVLAVAPLSWLSAEGLLNPDESGYSFQAHVFLTGKLMAPPLPGTATTVRQTPPELLYESHILRPNGWFTKFPPGWPLVLAFGQLMSAGWLVNPLLSVVLLLITSAIGQRIFSLNVALLSVLFAIFSPFYLVNSVGMMSHTFCGVLVAFACLCLFRGVDTGQFRHFGLMFASLGAAFHVRPYTAFAVSCVMGTSALWLTRQNRPLVKRVILFGFFSGALTVVVMLAYNHLYTGHALISPYAFFAGSNAPPELMFHPRQILRSIQLHGRQTIVENITGVFPFLYLLAGYAVLRESRFRQQVFVLAAVYLSLVLAYLAHVEAGGGGVFFGKRFHFEGLFALFLLGARGLDILVENWKIPQPALLKMLAALVLFQVLLQGTAAWAIVRIGTPYRVVREAISKPPSKRVVFLHDSPGFVAKHLNLNDADWPHAAQIYLIDAEPSHRSEWACRYGMPTWIAVTYNPLSRRADVESGQARCSVAGMR